MTTITSHQSKYGKYMTVLSKVYVSSICPGMNISPVLIKCINYKFYYYLYEWTDMDHLHKNTYWSEADEFYEGINNQVFTPKIN